MTREEEIAKVAPTLNERLILIMLAEIHQHLKIDDGIDSKLIAAALRGHDWALWYRYSDMSDTHEQVPYGTVDHVFRILTVWERIETWFAELSQPEQVRVIVEAEVTVVAFPGFDTESAEINYLSAAEFITEELGKFSMFRGRCQSDHCPTLDRHRAVLAAYEQMGSPPRPTADQIIKLLQA